MVRSCPTAAPFFTVSFVNAPGIFPIAVPPVTMGTVTADWSADGLASGKGAYKVNDRVVVALNTATPLYRDLKTGDKGDDVLALNNELSRLGYNSVAGSDTYWWATSDDL